MMVITSVSSFPALARAEGVEEWEGTEEVTGAAGLVAGVDSEAADQKAIS